MISRNSNPILGVAISTMRCSAWLGILFLPISSVFAQTGFYWNRNDVLTTSTDFNKAYNWTDNQDGTGVRPISAEDDYFTADALDASWTFRDYDTDGATGANSLTANADQLTLSGRGAFTWGSNNRFVAVQRADITGDFDVSVKVVSMTSFNATEGKVGILMADDITALGSGGYAIAAVKANGSVNIEHDANTTVGEIDTWAAGATGAFPVWIRLVKNGTSVSVFFRRDTQVDWTQVGTAVTPQSTDGNSHIALMSCAGSAVTTATAVFDDFQAGTNVVPAAGYGINFAGTGAANGYDPDANATMTGSMSLANIDFTGYSGTFSFGSSTLTINTSWANFSAGTFTPATGTLAFTATSGTQTLTPSAGSTLPAITKSGAGTVAVATTGLTAGSLTLSAGTWDWGSGLTHSITSTSASAGTMTFNNSTVQVTSGSANLNSITTVNANTGTLAFTAGSGTQVFTPKTGQTMPFLTHPGASTLQLGGNTICLGFGQSAGILDFNSRNLTTTSGGGLAISNGTTTSLTNLGGRTLTIAGAASFTGQPGNLVNLNPGSSWTLAVTGLLTADYASIGNCNASVTGGQAYKSTNSGSNSGWTFNSSTYYWNRSDVITASTNFNRTYNWSSNADGTGHRPDAFYDDKFPSTSLSGAWTFQDSDNDGNTGSYALSGGQLSLTGRGADVFGGVNQFVAVRRADNTNTTVEIIVKVVSQANTDQWAKAGILLADDFTALGSGGFAMLAVTPGQGFTLQYDFSGPVGELDSYAQSGSAVYPCWLRMVRQGTALTAYYKTAAGNAWTQIGGSVTPQSFDGTQIGLFMTSHDAAETGTVVFDDFHSGIYFAATDNDLSFNGSGGGSFGPDANANLVAGTTVNSIDFTGYTGTFNFLDQTLTVGIGDATFVSGMTVTPGTGTLAFTNPSTNQTLTPAGKDLPSITKSGNGGILVSNSALYAGALTVNAGTFIWNTSGATHEVASIATAGGSAMTFGDNTVRVISGNADMSGLGYINFTSGTLAFTGTTGTQIFTPKSATSHPNITHTGAAVLQLATNDLSCLSFAQSAGILDLNGRNITTTSSGNFTLTNGTAASFRGLNGRTLTVAGNASFTGQSGNLANLDGTSWTLNVTGTLAASYALISGSNASGGSLGVATNSLNGGANSNWSFPSQDFTAWTYSQRIAFNTTASGAGVTGNVIDFPMLLRFTGNNFVFSQAKSDGADLRFTDPDGSALPYQIERWDATSKLGEVWVKVPQVDGNSSSDYIRMHWGNAAATTLSNGPAVFDTTDNYRGVYHLGEDGNTTVGGYLDATASGNPGTGFSMTADSDIEALAGKGHDFDGSADYIRINRPVSDDFTIAFWMRADAPGLTGAQWFYGNGLVDGEVSGGGANDYGVTYLNNKAAFGTGNADQTVQSSGTVSDGAWHHVVATRVRSSGAKLLYVDGVQAGSGTGNTNALTAATYLRFGMVQTDFNPFNGKLDEIQILNTVRSADWVKLSYQTQKPATAAVVYPDADLSTWAYSTRLYLNTTASGANVPGDVANFPLLVRLSSANFNFAQANSDGSDIRFADSAGALLAYEIERWDASARAAEIWVLIPNVEGNHNSQWFKMHWGKGTAVSLSSSASVFRPVDGHIGSWHMNDVADVSDASGTAPAGTNTGAANGSGIVGGAAYFDADADLISVAPYSAVEASSLLVDGSGYAAFSFWVKATDDWNSAADRRLLFTKGRTATLPNTQDWAFWVDPATDQLKFETRSTAPSWTNWTLGKTDWDANTWYHIALVNDIAGKSMQWYLNGVPTSAATYATSHADEGGNYAVEFGNHVTDTWFTGYLDEVRIIKASKSADWHKLSYENQKDGSAVVSVGARSRDYAKSVQLNFNTTNSGGGANVSGNVANIPMLVRLTSANFDFTQVRDDAADIKFIDKDGTNLYHEVVEWDKGNKAGKVWVKVPQVDGNSTADFITLYYGCASCTGNPFAIKDSVWAGFNGVWHMRGDEDKIHDATPNGNHGLASHAMPLASGITTPLSPVLDGTSHSFTINNHAALDGETMTMAFWIKTSAVGDNATWYNSTWILDRDIAGNGDDWAAVLANGTSQLIFVTRTNNLQGTANIGGGTWHHVVLKKTPTNKYIYVDGALDVTIASADVISNDEPIHIGSELGTGDFMAGQFTEFSLAGADRSADWIKLAYQNQKESSTLISASGITAASFSASKVFKFNTTSTGANIPGDVHNFPLLLRITGSTIVDAVQNNAPDVRFLDADGVTWLDYQVQRWNKTLDSAEVWVKVPRIDGNSASDYITLYYNDVVNGAVPDGQCAACAFDGSFMKAVYHLDDNAATATVAESRGAYTGTFKQNLVGNHTTDNHDAEGIVGSGFTFNGTSDFVDIGTNSAIIQNVSGVTFSAWVKPSTFATSVRNAIFLSYGTNGTGSRAKLTFPTSGFIQAGGRAGDGESVSAPTTSDLGLITGNWYHLAASINYAEDLVTVYVNGVKATIPAAAYTAATTSNTPSAATALGAIGSGATEHFGGLMDEVQIASTALDTNWLKLTFHTQRRDASPLFNPSPSDFVSTRRFSFNTTRTGANVMDSVANFPLLVRLTGSALVDAVQNDWDDIRFLDGDGKTWLNYQVERWDKANDVAEVWVLVPQVDGNSDRDFITLYYDDATNGAVPSGQCAACVFSPSNGFSGVWHLGEDGNDVASNYADATGNGYHGTGNTMTNSLDVDAIAGKGVEMTGADANYIGLGTAAGSTASHTVSFWMNADAVTFQSVVDKLPNDASAVGWTFKARNAAENNEIWYRIGSESGAGSRTDIKKASAYAAGTWVHVTGTFGSGTGRLYINGQLGTQTTGITKSPANATTPLRIGDPSASAVAEEFDGKLDELQISSTVRDSNWVRLTYETQRATQNRFFETRAGPNNRTTLTASAETGAGINLSWTLPVSDSSAADSVGLWVRYDRAPDSAFAASTTHVVRLAKTDSAYSYPATYPGTYYFGLAVRNAAGQWSPISKASSDTAVLGGNAFLNDTIYVDSAIGNNANSCALARNPATPKATTGDASLCSSGSNDTLVIRIMPGTYTADWQFDSDADPVIFTSFDRNSRAIFASASGSDTHNSVTYKPTVYLFGGAHLRDLDIMAGQAGGVGVMTNRWPEGGNSVTGCRIYNNGATKHAIGIFLPSIDGNNQHIANNIVYQPTSIGILSEKDDLINIVNNTLIGDGSGGSKGIQVTQAAFAANMTIANNILHNWGYGIQTVSSTAATGVVSNNLFHLVTTGQEMTGSTDANKITKDPLFYSTDIRNPRGYMLLPGSPAIDAGTTASGGGYTRTTPQDAFGSVRPQGTAPDIGAYEGTGFTPNPTGDFDTLTNTVLNNTVIVKNTKWKLVWDMARSGGITGFYDMTGDTTANLVGGSSLLFDIRLDANLASAAPTNNLAPVFLERTRARSLVRQRVAFNASMDLNVYYSVYASGHVYIQSEIANLSGGVLDLDVVQYNLKVGAATTVTQSAGSLAGISYKNGFGFLTAATKDPLLAVTRDLDGQGYFSETWSQVGSIAGAVDSLGFSTSDLADLALGMKRHHHFLLYVGDGNLDYTKAATLNADAYTPSPVSTSAGSVLHERSWQDRLGGHWTFDDGAGASAKDKSVNYTNHAALTSTAWIAGKVNGALRFTTSSVATVTDHDALEAAQNRTISLWVKPDFAAMGADAFLLSKGLTAGSGWHFRRVSGVSKFKFVMGAVEVQTPTLTAGAWVHLAASVNASRLVTLYVNGVLVGAGAAATTTTANADNMLIGKSGADADAFAGDIDDVRIYHFNPNVGMLQAIVQRGFSQQYGIYHLRADNNNRVVALLNETVAQTRVQPAFEIANWYGTKTPKYVYLNGIRLVPNVDFVVDSLVYAGIGAFGSNLVLQVNRMLTGTSQTLFVDDNDSSGYMGEAARMKTLSVTATAGDKIALQNFTGSTFGSATSGQWYLELDLTGWTDYATARVVDTGFGGFNVWKAAGANPGLAVSSAANQVGQDNNNGRSLAHMSYHGASADFSSSGQGYFGPASLGYTVVDSSSTRLSLVLDAISLKSNAPATATVVKRWTVYPNGRIIGSFTLSAPSINMTNPRLDFITRNASGSAQNAWANTSAASTGRWAAISSDVDMHSVGVALLSVKNAAATYDTIGTQAASGEDFGSGVLPQDYYLRRLNLQTSYFTTANAPVTTNFVIDISRDFTDALTADSLLKDLQTPAVITALGAGTANPTDALDYGSPSNSDGFAEGDGAYVYTAGSGIAHFKFVNTVTHFSPAFRIKSWSYGTLPEFVTVDNQTLTRNYHYNAYVNTATDELILQFNKTFKPGTHLFYISHKTGLAVTLNHFEAIGGEGVDTLRWSTESEFENLGFHLYRRVAPIQDLPDSLFAGAERTAGAGIANALVENARAQAAAKKATDTAGGDTLPELSLSLDDLRALGYVRITAKLLPGAKGGASAITQAYEYIDRAAAFGTTYEYLLEAVDFHGVKAQYGPRKARPSNPLETALLPNYPNPFNPITTLRFSLKDKARVSLVVYDARGRMVRTLLRPDKPMLPGKYRLIWDAKDDKGFEVPSGQYFYRFTAPRYTKTRKMILVK